MPLEGRKPKDCYEPFREHVAKLVCTTLCNTASFAVERTAEDLRFRLKLNPPGSMIPLATNIGPLHLYIGQALEAEKVHRRRYRLHTRQYWYRLHEEPGLDSKALIRWEYDRDDFDPRSARPPRNHVHVAAHVLAHGEERDLKDLHVPTGWVLLESVIRFLIADFGVVPLCGSKWPDVLADGEQQFRDIFT